MPCGAHSIFFCERFANVHSRLKIRACLNAFFELGEDEHPRCPTKIVFYFFLSLSLPPARTVDDGSTVTNNHQRKNPSESYPIFAYEEKTNRDFGARSTARGWFALSLHPCKTYH